MFMTTDWSVQHFLLLAHPASRQIMSAAHGLGFWLLHGSPCEVRMAAEQTAVDNMISRLQGYQCQPWPGCQSALGSRALQSSEPSDDACLPLHSFWSCAACCTPPCADMPILVIEQGCVMTPQMRQ